MVCAGGGGILRRVRTGREINISCKTIIQLLIKPRICLFHWKDTMTSSFVKTDEVKIKTYEKMLILNQCYFLQGRAETEVPCSWVNNNIYPQNIKNPNHKPALISVKSKDVWKVRFSCCVIIPKNYKHLWTQKQRFSARCLMPGKERLQLSWGRAVYFSSVSTPQVLQRENTMECIKLRPLCQDKYLFFWRADLVQVLFTVQILESANQ